MTLVGETLASTTFDVTLDPVAHIGLPLPADVATFGDSANELIVATPSDDAFVRVIYNGTDVIDQKLEPTPFKASAEPADDGYALTVTATGYVRDLFCMVDKVDSAASIDGGLAILLPGESVTWHIASNATVDPQAFVAANVLRCANDLKH